MVGFAQTTNTSSDFYPLNFSDQRNLFILPNSPYKVLYTHLISLGTHPEVIQKIENARLYIDNYWAQLIVHPEEIKEEDTVNGMIKLPAPYIMPMAKGGLHARFFYWDSWFTSLPHIGTDREYVAIGAVENCAFLFEKYGVIPNQADLRFLHRSQPPLFTSMIMNLYYAFAKRTENDSQRLQEHKEWMKKYIAIAKKEYETVWTSSGDLKRDEKLTYNHRKYAFTMLSNWGDRDIGSHHASEYESGKDTTAEFAGRAGDFLPVDLNCFLLKYELDFAEAAKILNDSSECNKWIARAEQRKKEMNLYMWDEATGFFYNYDVKRESRDTFKTLSGYQSLWAGLATAEQAERMMENISWFESDHGLMTTAPESNPPSFEELNMQKLHEAGIPDRYLETIRNVLLPGQWTAPNIWSPTQLLAVKGFMKYGYTKSALRIIKKSLVSLASFYSRYKTMPEKRNGYTGLGGGDHTYPDKSGFGWTNAEFIVNLQLLQELIKNEILDLYTPFRETASVPQYQYHGV